MVLIFYIPAAAAAPCRIAGIPFAVDEHFVPGMSGGAGLAVNLHAGNPLDAAKQSERLGDAVADCNAAEEYSFQIEAFVYLFGIAGEVLFGKPVIIYHFCRQIIINRVHFGGIGH